MIFQNINQSVYIINFSQIIKHFLCLGFIAMTFWDNGFDVNDTSPSMSQMEQTSDENWAPNMEKPVWYCTSSRAHTSIAKYAEYQAETIRDHFQQTVIVILLADHNVLTIFFSS